MKFFIDGQGCVAKKDGEAAGITEDFQVNALSRHRGIASEGKSLGRVQIIRQGGRWLPVEGNDGQLKEVAREVARLRNLKGKG